MKMPAQNAVHKNIAIIIRVTLNLEPLPSFIFQNNIQKTTGGISKFNNHDKKFDIGNITAGSGQAHKIQIATCPFKVDVLNKTSPPLKMPPAYSTCKIILFVPP